MGLYITILFMSKNLEESSILYLDGMEMMVGVQKKIIEPMYFSGKNKVKFGLPIFKLKDKSKKRFFYPNEDEGLETAKFIDACKISSKRKFNLQGSVSLIGGLINPYARRLICPNFTELT